MMQDDMTGRPGVAASASAAEAYGRLYSIVARLRAPDGCPWDREQSPPSLRGSVVEEAYELVEAIDEANPPHIAEEAGDLFLLATMICYMHEQKGAFSVADALRGIGDKLIRRHPHVFGEAVAETPDAVLKQWDEIKEKVEGRRRRTRSSTRCRALSRPSSGPTSSRRRRPRSASTGRARARSGRSSAKSWPKPSRLARLSAPKAPQPTRSRGLTAREALGAEGAAAAARRAALEEELGDLLFSAINISRFLDVDPAIALHSANEKFSRRFRQIEKRMAESGKEMSAENMGLMDRFWDETKRAEGER